MSAISTNGRFLPTHGGRMLPEYNIWRGMKKRCYLVSDRVFKYYGAKGVTVCEQWRNSFARFLADVGRRPSGEYSLDRYPNASGNYEPGNVRWATDIQQNRNRGAYNLMLELGGESMTAAEWHEKLGVSLASIYKRKEMGWSDERTLMERVRYGRRPRGHLEVK